MSRAFFIIRTLSYRYAFVLSFHKLRYYPIRLVSPHRVFHIVGDIGLISQSLLLFDDTAEISAKLSEKPFACCLTKHIRSLKSAYHALFCRDRLMADITSVRQMSV